MTSANADLIRKHDTKSNILAGSIRSGQKAITSAGAEFVQDILRHEATGEYKEWTCDDGQVLLTSAQNISGVKTFEDNLIVSASIGIGIDTPQGTLHVQEGYSSASPSVDYDTLVLKNNGNCGVSILGTDANYQSIVLGSESDVIGSQISWNYDNREMLITTDTSAARISLRTGTDGKRDLIITSAGDVGIGILDPDDIKGKLHVSEIFGGGSYYDPSTGYDTIVCENGADCGMSILGPDGSYQALIFGSQSDTYGAQINWRYSDDRLIVGTHKTGAHLAFHTNLSSEQMVITSAGYVGINTTLAGTSATLHVNGDMRFDISDLYINGTAGHTGSFDLTASSTVTVENGIITNVA